jgi:hypothetical protein
MERSDSLTPIPPRFVAFAWRYHPCAEVCSQRPRRATVGIGELMFRFPSRICRWRRQGLPGSRATLNVPWPCSWTPVGPDAPGHCGAPTWPPHVSTTRAPAREDFGARSQSLGTGCLRFAVRITPPHARLASGCLAKPGRAGFVDPQSDEERFPSSSLFLLSRAFLAR